MGLLIFIPVRDKRQAHEDSPRKLTRTCHKALTYFIENMRLIALPWTGLTAATALDGMRILQLIRSLNPKLGGTSAAVLQLSQALVELGTPTELACLDRPDDPWIRTLPLRTHALGPGAGTYGYCPRLVPWLRAQAASYDCVAVHGCWQYPGFAARRALRHSGTPYVVFAHGMLAAWFKRTYPLKHAKKWLYWPWGEYRVLRDARAVIFASEQEKLEARRSFWLYRAREIVIPFGAPAPSPESGAQRDCFLGRFPELAPARVALFLGRIHPIKACDDLIRAFASAVGGDPNWRLVIAGPDQAALKPALMRLAAETGIAQRVTWTGMLDGDLKEGAFHSAEVLVLPSHHESFGMAAVEALARGLPVLISDKVNIWREVVADGAGLAANDDAASLAGLLRRWTALPQDEKEAMRERARQCFARRFAVRKVARDLVAALESLLQS